MNDNSKVSTHSLQKFSILLTSYNKLEHFDDIETLSKILIAKGAEIVIVDDGSTDGSFDALQELTQRMPELKIISQPNSGSASARNTVMENATREYFVFLDFDDVLNISVLEQAALILEKVPTNMALLNYKIMPKQTLSIMPLSVQSPTITTVGLIRNELFGSMGYWRYIYSKNFIQSNHLEFTPTFKDVGRFFILDDLFWLLHNASMNSEILVFPEDWILYDYYLSPQDPNNWERFRRQVEVFPLAALFFLKKLEDCQHSHDETWLHSKLLETTNMHLRFLFLIGFFKSVPAYLRLRRNMEIKGFKQNTFSIILDIFKIGIRCVKNQLLQYGVIAFIAGKIKGGVRS